MNPLIQSKNEIILPVLIALTFGCFALSPSARAVCQEGCFGLNTFLGEDALLNDTNGGNANTATGFEALWLNTTGYQNTGNGAFALSLNVTGADNTATGYNALSRNRDGNENTATGHDALDNNTAGSYNTANGGFALFANIHGSENTAVGFAALEFNTHGFSNTAIGINALQSNRFGGYNAASGSGALGSNTTGSNNTASGYAALGGNTTGKNNIALGNKAGFNLTAGSGNIDIGNPGIAGESSTIRIGRVGDQTTTLIAGISGVTIAGGVGVIVDTNGQLGTIVSSERFKDEVKPMDKASEAILALKPVTFRYKHELDPKGIPQFGLVAEDVEKVNPDLVARDEQGKPYTVRYEAVNAMLLNEFLKEHRHVQEQDATIARQQKQIDALTAGLQKVSAQLELSKAAPQAVLNSR
jgi:hypothetical protein